MELSLSHALHLFIIFREYDGKDNCAQVLEEEISKMFGTKSLNYEHDCNVVSMNSLNIHDANDMQSHKLGEAMFDEYDIFCPPSFDEQIYYDESMPPIYDDYCDDTYAIKKKFAYVESSKFSMLVGHEKNDLGAGYIVEFIHYATKNYYEEGIYACRNCNNIKFPLYVLKVL